MSERTSVTCGCILRAFMWDVEWGGLAYNYTIASLKRRAVSLWSENYRRRRHGSRRHSR